MKNKVIKNIFGMVLDILIALIIVFSLIIAIITLTTNKDGIPNIGGYSPFSIQSNSMEPTLKKGDLIIVKKYDNQAYKEGDIISFFAYEKGNLIIITHRVVKVNTDKGVYTYITKGDNNEEVDSEELFEDDLVGIYTGKKVRYAGFIIDFVKNKFVYFFLILIPLLIIFIKEIIGLFKLMLEDRLEAYKK